MKLINIRKTYHNKNNTVEALKGINLELNSNGITILLGASGSGKSTLLNILSGQDKDYEGELLMDRQLDYITQDFRLFEEMSIKENLLLVSDDLQAIDDYLRQFSLKDHENKKVKKCSNGQKKRVQFIRSLLRHPQMLICDEPTAALDHENAHFLMNQLQAISHKIPIFLVTHDIALCEEYADRILKMENGTIIEDRLIHQITEASSNSSSFSSLHPLKVCFYEMKSRPIETIFMTLMALLLCISIFVCSQMFQNVQKQMEEQYVWENRINQIVTQIDDKNKITSEISSLYDEIYENFDVYTDEQINYAIENVEGILAVEKFYDVFVYDNVARTMTIQDWQAQSFKQDYAYFGEDKYFPYVMQPAYYPLFINKDRLNEQALSILGENIQTMFVNDKGQLISKTYEKLEDIPYEEFPYILNRATYGAIMSSDLCTQIHFHPYELVENKTLPLIQGRMPQSLNEVVVDQNSAKIIRAQYGFESIEDILGQTIEIAIPYANARFMMGKESRYHFNSITISGISAFQTPNERHVYFLKEGVKNTLLKDMVNEEANVSYTIVNFLVDAKSDSTHVCDQINELMPIDQNRFILAIDTLKDKETHAYQNPKVFALYSLLTLFALCFILVIYYELNRKRIKKEKNILKTYGYSIHLDSILRLGFIYILASIIWILISTWFIPYVNELAKNYHYDHLLQSNLLWLLWMCLLAYLIHLIIERLCKGK